MNNAAREKLCELVARFGSGIADDPRRCEALLRDVCGQCKPEISVLVSAARERVPSELLATSGGAPLETTLSKLTKRLHEHLGLRSQLARWGVESWALALNVAQASDLRIPFQCPACNTTGLVTRDCFGRTVRCLKCQARLRISNDGMPQLQTAEVAGETKRAEDILRQTQHNVFSDGVVTEQERIELDTLRAKLGISSEVANRILSDVSDEKKPGVPPWPVFGHRPITGSTIIVASDSTIPTPPPRIPPKMLPAASPRGSYAENRHARTKVSQPAIALVAMGILTVGTHVAIIFGSFSDLPTMLAVIEFTDAVWRTFVLPEASDHHLLLLRVVVSIFAVQAGLIEIIAGIRMRAQRT